jgi:uncharacterized protein
MNRRTFFSSAAAAAVAAPLARAAESPPASRGGPAGLIDTNVYSSHWVVRRSWAETPSQLVAKLRRHGVTSAWVGSFDAVLHTDIAGVNARLAETCAREGDGLLRAFGTVNPALPDWEDDLRRCHETHRMPGVRLFPSYHGYGLDDSRFARFIDLATQRGLLVQIVVTIEDERSQNPLLTVAPLPLPPLADVIAKIPAARVMLLNSGTRTLGTSNPLLARLVAAGVWFELATLEGVAGLEGLFQRTPNVRMAFGSHSPYFYFESALLKLQESALTPEQLAAVRSGHALAALTGGKSSTHVSGGSSRERDLPSRQP